MALADLDSSTEESVALVDLDSTLPTSPTLAKALKAEAEAESVALADLGAHFSVHDDSSGPARCRSQTWNEIDSESVALAALADLGAHLYVHDHLGDGHLGAASPIDHHVVLDAVLHAADLCF